MMKTSDKWLSAISALALALGLAEPLQAQMTTPGSFAVSDMGAATYSVPVGMPAGVGGVMPQVFLTYSSQGDNGMLGVGWGLSGLSYITRCPKTLAQDGARGRVGLDLNDRYCLDGQRLVAITGVDGADKTEYRTEQDGLSKVISYGAAGTGSQGGPQYFIVKTKAGLTMKYGVTDDSRIEAQGQAVVRVWALNSVSDTKGNYMNIVYTEDNANGQYQPSEIKYTGNTNTGLAPMNSVHFDYETRPDIVPMYQAGSLIKYTKRMTRVWTTTTSGSTTPEVGEVRVQYEAANSPATARSRISTIQTCDGPATSSTAKCLPAIKMTWSGVAIKSLTPVSVSTTVTPPNVSDKFLIGDFDGDGKSDVVLIDTPNNTLYTYLSQGVAGSVLSMKGTTNSLSALGYNSGNQSGYSTIVSDFNGDGRSDILEIGPSGYYLLTSKGDGTFLSDGVHPFQSGFAWNSANCYLNSAMDLNGDGASDFVMACSQGSPWTSQKIQTYLNDGKGLFSATQTQSYQIGTPLAFIDLNGDGFPDVFCSDGDQPRTFYLSQKDGTFSSSAISLPADFGDSVCASTNGASYGQFVDFNGDGVLDCASVSINFGVNTGVYVKNYVNPVVDPQPSLGTGIVGLPEAYDGLLDPYLTGANKDKFLVDVNGDGILDIVFWSAKNTQTQPRQNGDFRVAIGRGDGYFDAQGATNYTMLLSGAQRSVFKSVADLTGDGRQGLITFIPANQAYIPNLDYVFVTLSTGAMYAYMPQGELPDLLTNIETGIGLGTSINVTYKPLTQMGSGYVKELKPVYPKVAVTPSTVVVSQTDMANGVGGQHTVTYRYGTAVSEMGAGRGFLGFNWVEHTDGPSSLTARTYYRQDWPYVGKVDRTAEYTSTGVWTGSDTGTPVLSNPGSYIKQQVNSYACLDISNPTANPLPACTVATGKRYLTYTTQASSSGQDLDGSAMPGDITTQTLDGWANPLTVSTQSSDGKYSKTTTNVYSNDTANWFLGRLLKSTVKSVSP